MEMYENGKIFCNQTPFLGDGIVVLNLGGLPPTGLQSDKPFYSPPQQINNLLVMSVHLAISCLNKHTFSEIL
jgi:hypothetical protein